MRYRRLSSRRLFSLVPAALLGFSTLAFAQGDDPPKDFGRQRVRSHPFTIMDVTRSSG